MWACRRAIQSVPSAPCAIALCVLAQGPVFAAPPADPAGLPPAQPTTTGETSSARAPKVLRAARADVAPVIDGVLDDPAWQDAALISEFHQIEPHEYAAPSEPTEVRVLYDDDHLYVGARLSDSEASRIGARQLIQGRNYPFDDRFHVLIDPFHDRRNGYFFQVNANGIRRDGLVEANDTFILDWDAIWSADARVDAGGWTAEIAIPFKSISFDATGETWGLNFGRLIPRKGEQTAWSSRGNEVFELAPAIAGELQGIRARRRGVGLEVVPSLTARDFDDRTRSEAGRELQPSLDVFYRPLPSFTLTGTVNTDFSATEVDDRQVNLTRFSLFFPEKRAFFLQDAGIFEFADLQGNGRPFFSRRIGLGADGAALDIEAGLKTTGRVGGLNFGALAVRQQRAGSDEVLDLAAARASWNVLEESSLGLIATSGDPQTGEDASLVGADFLYRDDDALALPVRSRLWVQKTDTTRGDDRDVAYGAALEFPGDRHEIALSSAELQENFAPTLGFANRVGIREHSAAYRYRFRPDTGRILRVDTSLGYELVTDVSDRRQSSLTSAGIEAASPQGDAIALHTERATEVLAADFEISDGVIVPARAYTFTGATLSVTRGDRNVVGGRLALQAGEFYDGYRRSVRAEVALRPSPHYALALVWAQNEIDLDGGSFITRLAQLRSDVAFNNRWAWLSFLQYDNVSGSAGVNSRLRWEIAPGREMFLVANYNFDVGPGDDLETRAREVALKVSYTFRP